MEAPHGTLRSRITKPAVAQLLHLPISYAAQQLNVSVALLKRTCRTFMLAKWPHRKLKAVVRKLKLVQTSPNPVISAQITEELANITAIRERVFPDIPQIPVDDLLYRLIVRAICSHNMLTVIAYRYQSTD